jgi:hypothetical protein
MSLDSSHQDFFNDRSVILLSDFWCAYRFFFIFSHSPLHKLQGEEIKKKKKKNNKQLRMKGNSVYKNNKK